MCGYMGCMGLFSAAHRHGGVRGDELARPGARVGAERCAGACEVIDAEDPEASEQLQYLQDRNQRHERLRPGSVVVAVPARAQVGGEAE